MYHTRLTITQNYSKLRIYTLLMLCGFSQWQSTPPRRNIILLFFRYQNHSLNDHTPKAPHPAQVCDGAKNGETFKLHRFMFNQAVPQSMEGTMDQVWSP